MKKQIIEAIVNYVDDDRLQQYKDVEKEASKQKIVDVSQVSYMPVYNLAGELVLVINPKRLAQQTAYIIAAMKDDWSSKFLSPYLDKKIIWSNEAKTAFTNGVRIAISPIFGHQMYAKGNDHLKENLAQITVDTTERNGDLSLAKNMARGLYVRFVIIHEIYHMIYQHIRRSILHISDPSDYQLHQIANIAQDIEINRDIVGRWPEYEKVITECGFLWFKDPKFINKDTGKPFNHETWEQIYDYLIEHQDQIPEQKQQPKANDPKQQVNKYPSGFKPGWDAAFNYVRNKKVDPRKINF